MLRFPQGKVPVQFNQQTALIMTVDKMLAMRQKPLLALWRKLRTRVGPPVSFVPKNLVGFVKAFRSDEEINIAGESHRRVAE